MEQSANEDIKEEISIEKAEKKQGLTHNLSKDKIKVNLEISFW